MQLCEQTNNPTKVRSRCSGQQWDLGMAIMAAVTLNHGHGNAHSNSQTGFLAFDLLITQKSQEIHKSQCAEVKDTLRK